MESLTVINLNKLECLSGNAASYKIYHTSKSINIYSQHREVKENRKIHIKIEMRYFQ